MEPVPVFVHTLRLDRQNDGLAVALAHSDRRGFGGRQVHVVALTRNEALRPDGLQESSGRSVEQELGWREWLKPKIDRD